MPKVLAKKIGHHTFAIKELYQDDVEYIGLGEEVKLDITKVRHPGRHDRYWAMVTEVMKIEGIQNNFGLQNLSSKQAKQIIHDQLKIDSGCCYTRQAIVGGQKYLIKTPKSINFDTMDDTEFNDFYQTAVNVLISKWFEEYLPADLVDQYADYFARNF